MFVYACSMSLKVAVSPNDIESRGTQGKRSPWVFRRIRIAPPVDAWGVVRYTPDLEASVRDMRGYIAGYLISLIEQLDTTDYLREWLARESPVEVPADFEGRNWLVDESFD